MRTKNPDIPSKEVRKLVISEQKKDYANEEGDYELQNVSREEAAWREKVNQRAFEEGEDLSDRSSWTEDSEDSGLDVKVTPVGKAPTPSDNENNKTHSTHDNKSEDSSMNKRNFSSVEEVGESSSQPAKRFKQDLSDVTGDTESFDFGGGDD